MYILCAHPQYYRAKRLYRFHGKLNFYLALYWSEALSQQTEDKEMADHFKPLFERLKSNESTIVNDLIAVQGKPVDLGGYYFPNKEKVGKFLWNTILSFSFTGGN